MSSPTQRSLAYLRKLGYVAQVTEHWIPQVNIRRDLWGFVDILALRSGTTLGVQTTTRGNISSRKRKILGQLPLPEEEAARFRAEKNAAEIAVALRECLAAGWQIEIHGWDKGDREPRIEYVTEADIAQ